MEKIKINIVPWLLRTVRLITKGMLLPIIILSGCSNDDITPKRLSDIDLSSDQYSIKLDDKSQSVKIATEDIDYRITFQENTFANESIEIEITPVINYQNMPLNVNFVAGLNFESQVTTFAKSIFIEMEVPFINSNEEFAIFHFDDESNNFVFHSNFENIDLNNSKALLSFEIDHFSVWGVVKTVIQSGCPMGSMTTDKEYEDLIGCLYIQYLTNKNEGTLESMQLLMESWFTNLVSINTNSISDTASIKNQMNKILNWKSKFNVMTALEPYAEVIFQNGLTELNERLIFIFENYLVRELRADNLDALKDGIENLFLLYYFARNILLVTNGSDAEANRYLKIGMNYAISSFREIYNLENYNCQQASEYCDKARISEEVNQVYTLIKSVPQSEEGNEIPDIFSFCDGFGNEYVNDIEFTKTSSIHDPLPDIYEVSWSKQASFSIKVLSRSIFGRRLTSSFIKAQNFSFSDPSVMQLEQFIEGPTGTAHFKILSPGECTIIYTSCDREWQQKVNITCGFNWGCQTLNFSGTVNWSHSYRRYSDVNKKIYTDTHRSGEISLKIQIKGNEVWITGEGSRTIVTEFYNNNENYQGERYRRSESNDTWSFCENDKKPIYTLIGNNFQDGLPVATVSLRDCNKLFLKPLGVLHLTGFTTGSLTGFIRLGGIDPDVKFTF
ncbi:hypothetical protein [Flexithrix dorotheae]|uniref:hypothetical protein n=1 Tax=Flexithrix dorotheae TaxID=70993 RepID=UPI000365C675|nr:hypothetical protein [Flexithrix dorotheae]